MDHTLEQNLLDWARRRLSQDFSDYPPSSSNLQDYAAALCKAAFSHKFGYGWTSSGCMPLSVARSGSQMVSSMSGYRAMLPGDDRLRMCRESVDQALSGVDFSRASGNAKADALARVGDCTGRPVDNDWGYDTGSFYYNSASPGGNTFQLDFCIVYSNAVSTGSAVASAVHVFHLLAVFYNNQSSTIDAVVNDYQAQAYKGADSLRNIYRDPVKTDYALKGNLEYYAGENGGLFQQDFRRLFNDKPPNAATDETRPIYTTNSHLACFSPSKEDAAKTLEAYVGINMLGGLDISGDLAAWAKDLVFKECKTILGYAATNMWLSTCINQTYGSYKDNMRPIGFNAELVFWNSSQQTVVNGRSVQVDLIYIYFLGLLYEFEADPIHNDLAHQLAINIPDIVQSTVPKLVTLGLLREYVEAYNRTIFQKAYHIDFPTVPDIDQHLRHWTGFFEFGTWYPTQDSISKMVDYQIFPEDPKRNCQIHHGLQGPIHNWLVDELVHLANGADQREANHWESITCSKDFPYTFNGTQWTLQVKTSWAYVSASLVEGDESLQPLFFSLLLRITASSQ